MDLTNHTEQSANMGNATCTKLARAILLAAERAQLTTCHVARACRRSAGKLGHHFVLLTKGNLIAGLRIRETGNRETEIRR
jgi:hypothetical protein